MWFIFTVIPTIQHGPQVFSTIEGTPISLPCRSSGVPAPEITWAKVCVDIMCVYEAGAMRRPVLPLPFKTLETEGIRRTHRNQGCSCRR